MNLPGYLFRQSWPIILLTTAISSIAGLSGTARIGVIGKAISTTGSLNTRVSMFVFLCVLYVLSKLFSDLALLRMMQLIVLHLRMTFRKKLLTTAQKKLQLIGEDGLQVMHQYLHLFVKGMSRLNVGNLMFYQGLGFIFSVLPRRPQSSQVKEFSQKNSENSINRLTCQS